MIQRALAVVGVLIWVLLVALGCSEKRAHDEQSVIATDRAALTVIADHDFEDGTVEGWIPRGAVTLTNTTEAAADGTRSLKTTGRTQNFHGPSLNVFGVLTRGATYEFTVKARLVPGEAPTTLRLTMQQTIPGNTNQFFTVAQASNATDGAFVTMTGTFSYNVDITALLLYVEATTAT